MKKKFVEGNIIKANRSGSKALVVSVDLIAMIYTLKYISPEHGIHSYDIESVHHYWDLESEGELSLKKCDCGIWKTFGKSIPIKSHSDWCELLRKKSPN